MGPTIGSYRWDASLRPTLILQRDTRDSPRKPCADQPGNLEGGLVITETECMNIGDAVAHRVGAAGFGREGQVSPEAVRR